MTSLDYAAAAERAGADRIELCTDLSCGGVTPSTRLMKAVRERLRIPIHVLIRPRAGDFIYSARELTTMHHAIEEAKKLKMDGIVLGILDRNSRIDVARTSELVELAQPLPVTFHRAFDETSCWQDSLEAVIQTGARRLLTSGCRANVSAGLTTLSRMVELSKGRLRVMPGRGITPSNVARIVRATSAPEVHASLITPALRETEGADRKLQTARYYRRALKMVSNLRSMRLYK